jgi:hypothetical protein
LAFFDSLWFKLERKILATFAALRFKLFWVAALALFGVALFAGGVGVANGQYQNVITNPTFNGLTGWTVYGGTTVTHVLTQDHKGGDGSAALGATSGRIDQTANLQMSGAHMLTLWIKASDPDCRVQCWLGTLMSTYGTVGSAWRKIGLVADFPAGNQNIRINWYSTGACTSTEIYVDDVDVHYTPELSPTVYTLDDVYDVLYEMRTADQAHYDSTDEALQDLHLVLTQTQAENEQFYYDTGITLDEVHHDIHETRHLATFYTTTFEIADDQWYQVATIGTYTDGERVMIACLIVMVMLQIFQFVRKELKG